MRLSVVLWTLLALVVLGSSCVPKGGIGPAQPTPQPAPSPTPEWTPYSGEGVVVKLPSADAVLPLTCEGFLFKAVVVGEDGTVYSLYVSSLGKGYGSSIEDLKRRRQADPNRLVVSEAEGECGDSEFYRIVYVDLPPKPGFVTQVVYYFYEQRELIAALFSCTSCEGPPDLEANYPTWESIVSTIERQ